MAGDLFRFDGRRVLIVGGASGMGAAACAVFADLGAEVVVMDVAEIPSSAGRAVHVDVRDRRSIDAALDAVGGPIHAAVSCAGVADPDPDLMCVNFVGQRYLLEELVARGAMPRGGAIAVISSTAGLNWERRIDVIDELLTTRGFEDALEWVAKHPELNNYIFSKQAMSAYVARQGLPMLQQGLRINATQPGPTNTPLARANAEVWLGSGKEYRAAAGVDVATPEQQAAVLAFLCSDAASYVNAANIVVDCGRTSGRMMHGFPPAWQW